MARTRPAHQHGVFWEIGPINEDLIRHLSGRQKNKNNHSTLNACCEFWASGLIAKNCLPHSPDCCGNTEAKPARSCERHWTLLSVIVDIFYGISTRRNSAGPRRVVFSVNGSKINATCGASEKRETTMELIWSATQTVCECAETWRRVL